MPKTLRTTRTLNPLPFEHLEPHRFEDLVRRLLYRFRDWSDIEPTGRGGSDDGFDIRAWENGERTTNIGEDGEQGARSTPHRLWQVQGKREKTLTPAKIRAIIRDDIDLNSPPHKYILAAATNISKVGHDTFREETRKRGVKESFFWGKDHLEDQLALPDNDEVLFTFFGISLSPRRRTRTAEIKLAINNKNKLLRLFFGNDGLSGQTGSLYRPRTILLRDIKDEHYPYSEEYPDFDKIRRWEEHEAIEVTEMPGRS